MRRYLTGRKHTDAKHNRTTHYSTGSLLCMPCQVNRRLRNGE